jgi:hypothetical protein
VQALLRALAAADYSGADPVREFWLGSKRLASVEILTTPTTAVIVATLLGA